MFRFEKYEDSLEEQWDKFITEKSINGTFLQSRRFFNYHPAGRFKDVSLVVYNEKNNIAALIPACELEQDGKKVFFSHKGTTFGGIIIDKKHHNAKHVVVLVEELKDYLKEQGYDEAYLKMTSDIFSEVESDLFQYAFQHAGYTEHKELSTYVNYATYKEAILSNFAQGKRTNVHNCEKEGLECRPLTTDDEIKELSVRYSIMLVLIPMGSIYIMNNVFMLGFTVNDNHTRINSAITVIILLVMNILIFYIYMKLADDLRLRRMASVYEQQLELCERHQQEREISILQLRDAKHNMKNNLVSILAYAENRQHEKIIGFINEIMEESGMAIAAISNSGNIVIDSLIGYWYVTAKKKEIDFKTDICIPMMLPFKGADICLILGNLLENAVEAAQKVDGKKYIEIKMKYDKNNILLSVTNSYSGKLLKTKDHRLKSTKTDTENHGVGLASVYRAVAKYCGTIIIDDSVSGQFKIRVLLYGNQE